MKLATRLLSTVLLVSLTLSVFATVEPVLAVKNRTSRTFLIKLEGMQNETFWINLVDQSGLILQSEQIEDQDTYKKLYNLKNLPDGHYTLKVENTSKVILQPIDIIYGRTIVDEAAKSTILKPKLNYQYPFIDLNMLHFLKEGIQVYIRDAEGNVVHQSRIANSGSVNKRFNVESLEKGDYVFEVKSKNYSYEQTFAVYRKKEANLIYEK